jgi:hypothetical protein
MLGHIRVWCLLVCDRKLSHIEPELPLHPPVFSASKNGIRPGRVVQQAHIDTCHESKQYQAVMAELPSNRSMQTRKWCPRAHSDMVHLPPGHHYWGYITPQLVWARRAAWMPVAAFLPCRMRADAGCHAHVVRSRLGCNGQRQINQSTRTDVTAGCKTGSPDFMGGTGVMASC